MLNWVDYFFLILFKPNSSTCIFSSIEPHKLVLYCNVLFKEKVNLFFNNFVVCINVQWNADRKAKLTFFKHCSIIFLMMWKFIYFDSDVWFKNFLLSRYWLFLDSRSDLFTLILFLVSILKHFFAGAYFRLSRYIEFFQRLIEIQMAIIFAISFYMTMQ